MKRCIIINWKWMNLAPCKEGAGISMEDIQVWKAHESQEDEVWCLNLPREEAAFEDEYDDCYDEPNQQLHNFLSKNIKKDIEVLLLLHKNAPHFYGSYDVDWLISQGISNVATFGGGEDFIYDLQNPKGLLDQVGNFSQKSLAGHRELKQAYFDEVWEHYVYGVRLMLHEFSRDLFPYLLPSTSAPIPIETQEHAAAIVRAISSKPLSSKHQLSVHQQRQLATTVWSQAFLEAMSMVAKGDKNASALTIREAVESL